MFDDPIKFHDDDGTEINEDLTAKPSLCISCAKDDDPVEEPICTLIRIDQAGEEEFQCDAFVSKEE